MDWFLLFFGHFPGFYSLCNCLYCAVVAFGWGKRSEVTRRSKSVIVIDVASSLSLFYEFPTRLWGENNGSTQFVETGKRFRITCSHNHLVVNEDRLLICLCGLLQFCTESFSIVRTSKVTREAAFKMALSLMRLWDEGKMLTCLWIGAWRGRAQCFHVRIMDGTNEEMNCPLNSWQINPQLLTFCSIGTIYL